MGRKKPTRGPIIEGAVRALARGGDAVVDTDDGVVFCSGAFVGERIRMRGEGKRGGVLRASLLEVLEPSAQRRQSVCKIQGRCGGCPWMPLKETAQASAKLDFVRGAVGAEQEIQWVSGATLGYRRRARLAWRNRSLGYRRERSRVPVDVERCPVLQSPLQDALSSIRSVVLPELRGRGELRLARSGDGAVAYFQTDDSQQPAAYAAVEQLVAADKLVGLCFEVQGAKATIGDPAERYVGADGKPISGPSGGFSQAHDLNEELVRTVAELADGAGLTLELYAGHGNFSVALAGRVKELVTVEFDSGACQAARQNLKERELDARVVEADAARYPKGGYDLVVLDPPRAGAKAPLERLLSERLPRRVIYVSCDTATLGRDIERLRARGYRPIHASAFDLFPQTAHVETLVALDRVETD